MNDIYRFKPKFNQGMENPVTAVSGIEVPNFSQVQSMIDGHIFQLTAARADADIDVDVSTGGLITLDGVTLVAGDRVLLTAQTDPLENGVWIAASGAWARSSDTEVGDVLKPGTRIFVDEGTDHGGHEYKLDNATDATVGTDALVWGHVTSYVHEARHIDVDNANFDTITGSTTQAVLESVDDKIKANEDAIAGIDVSAQIAAALAANVHEETVTIGTGQTIITHGLEHNAPSITIQAVTGEYIEHTFLKERVSSTQTAIYNAGSPVVDCFVVMRK